jgi:hypothetical protein
MDANDVNRSRDRRIRRHLVRDTPGEIRCDEADGLEARVIERVAELDNPIQFGIALIPNTHLVNRDAVFLCRAVEEVKMELDVVLRELASVADPAGHAPGERVRLDCGVALLRLLEDLPFLAAGAVEVAAEALVRLLRACGGGGEDMGEGADGGVAVAIVWLIERG